MRQSGIIEENVKKHKMMEPKSGSFLKFFKITLTQSNKKENPAASPYRKRAHESCQILLKNIVSFHFKKKRY